MTQKRRCIVEWTMDSDQSVLREQRSVGPHRNDFFERYSAALIDANVQQPVASVSRFKQAGRPIFWFTADRRDVVVDAAFSSDLVAVNVPRLKSGEVVSIGVLSVATRSMPPREVLELFVRADVLRTYWHIGSELCLTHEAVEAGSYRAEVRGVHTYFTSGRNQEPFAFAFELGARGELVVRGMR